MCIKQIEQVVRLTQWLALDQQVLLAQHLRRYSQVLRKIVDPAGGQRSFRVEHLKDPPPAAGEWFEILCEDKVE